MKRIKILLGSLLLLGLVSLNVCAKRVGEIQIGDSTVVITTYSITTPKLVGDVIEFSNGVQVSSDAASMVFISENDEGVQISSNAVVAGYIKLSDGTVLTSTSTLGGSSFNYITEDAQGVQISSNVIIAGTLDVGGNIKADYGVIAATGAFSSTVSAANPTEDDHLTTKSWTENAIATATGSIVIFDYISESDAGVAISSHTSIAGNLNMNSNAIYGVSVATITDAYITNLHGGSDINILDSLNCTYGIAASTIAVSGAASFGATTIGGNLGIGANYISNDGDSEGLSFQTDGDAVFSNSVFIGETAITYSPSILSIEDEAIDMTDSFYGQSIRLQKMTGVTDETDHIYGIRLHVEMNDVDSTIGDMVGINAFAEHDNGTMGTGVDTARLVGIVGSARLYHNNNPTINGYLAGVRASVDTDGASTLNGDAYGMKIETIDLDATMSGNSYYLHMDRLDGTRDYPDYGIYQAGTAVDNHFEGTITAANNIGIGSNYISNDKDNEGISIEADGDVIFSDNVMIGDTTKYFPTSIFNIENEAISTTDSIYGSVIKLTKTAGATDENDQFIGQEIFCYIDDDAAVHGHARAAYNAMQLAGASIMGTVGSPKSLRAEDVYARTRDTSVLNGDLVGAEIYTAMTDTSEVTGNIYGIHMLAGGPGPSATLGGTAYMLYINDSNNNWDYGFYQTGDVTTGNYFKSDTGFGTITSPSEDVHAADTIRADTFFNHNGSDGVSGTYNFNGGSGEVTQMTISGGIVTSVTVAP